MGTKNLEYVVKKLKLRYAGHMKWNREDRWEKRVNGYHMVTKTKKKGETQKRVGRGNYKNGWDCLGKGCHGLDPVEEDE